MHIETLERFVSARFFATFSNFLFFIELNVSGKQLKHSGF